MAIRILPGFKDIIYSAIAMIHNHRHIKNPIVTNPVPNADGSFTPVPVDSYRNYDGIELLEPGLTIAVFPAFTAKTEKAAYSLSSMNSAKFEVMQIGPKAKDFLYEATYSLVIAVYYQEVAIGETKNIVYFSDDKDRIQVESKAALIGANRTYKNEGLTVEINPGEDIVRDYIDVLRLIIEEGSKGGLLPWSIRSSEVKAFDFPTSSWLRQSNDIYFHMAYLAWDISLYVPSHFPDNYPPTNTVETLNVIDQRLRS